MFETDPVLFMETAMFPPNHIHVGRDEYLFLVQGSNNVSSQYVKSPEMQWLLWQWRHAIYTRDKRLRSMNIVYKHVTMPEKLTIYDNLLSGIEINWRLSPALRLLKEDPYFVRYPGRLINVARYLRRRNRWKNILIDLVMPLRKARDDQMLFLRTDSHLSFAGLLIAYREICHVLGVKPVRDFWERPTHYEPNFTGDLGRDFVPLRMEGVTLYLPQRDAVRIYASPIVAHRERAGAIHTLHTGSHVIYRNEKAADPRSMILFGDSYSNITPNMLTIVLAETFREVHYIWSTSVDWNYIEKIMPDIVLTEMSERFIFRAPDDTFNLEAYCVKRYGEELRMVSE